MSDWNPAAMRSASDPRSEPSGQAHDSQYFRSQSGRMTVNGAACELLRLLDSRDSTTGRTSCFRHLEVDDDDLVLVSFSWPASIPQPDPPTTRPWATAFRPVVAPQARVPRPAPAPTRSGRWHEVSEFSTYSFPGSAQT